MTISSSTCIGRILSVTSNFPRWKGDSTTPFVLHLAQDLQKHGWRVDILAPHAPDCAEKESMQGVSVERFRYLWPEKFQSVCYQGGGLINLRKQKTNYLKLPALVGAEWAAVSQRLLTGQYDLLHSHWLLPQGFVGCLAARLTGIPHVVTIHGGDVFGLRQKAVLPFKQFALSQANAVTVNSTVTENEVRKLSDRCRKILRIPMGVDIKKFPRDHGAVLEIRRKYRQGQGPLLVFVGRLVEEKGVGDLIQAVHFLADDCPGIGALILGEGQDRGSFERLTQELGLKDRIHFIGWVDQEAVPFYLSAGDIFVGPSRTAQDGWIEAQGLTFLEAMSAGTPVVATRVGGIVDSVIHEQTGLLVDERSPKQIAGAVMRLQNNKSLIKELVKNGKERVKQNFSRQVSGEAFSHLFYELLNLKRDVANKKKA